MHFLTILRDRLAERRAELEATDARMGALSDEEPTEVRSADAIATDIDAARAVRAALVDAIAEDEARLAELEAVEESRRQAPAFNRNAGQDPYDVEIRSAPRTAEVARDFESRALRAVERDEMLSDESRGRVEALIRSRSVNRDGAVARHVLATGRPAYRSAFGKLVRHGGHVVLDEHEARALEEVRSINITTDADGGYLMPFVVDPTIVLNNDGRINPMRRLASVRTVAADNWHGITTEGVVASWRGEAVETTATDPTFARPELTVKKGDVFVPFTTEAEEDFSNLASEVSSLIQDARDELEGAAFTTGAGSATVPQGIVTGLVAVAARVVASAGADTYADDDVYALFDSIAPRFDGNSVWMMHKLIRTKTRQLVTDDGHSILDPMERTVLGQPIELNSFMDSTITAAADNYVVVYGDIARCYRIIDRIGLRIEVVPHLFGANGLPTGERGWYARWRTGAGVLEPKAASVLNVT